MLSTRLKRAALWRASAIVLSSCIVAGCFAPDPADDIDPPRYSVLAGPISPAAPGGAGSLELHIAREDGFDQAITVDPSTAQAALQWASLVIPAGATQVTLPFTVPAGVSAGAKLIHLVTKSAGERQVTLVVSVPVTAAGTFLFTVDQVITVGNPGMTLFRGYRAARNGMTAPITISAVSSPGITTILPFTQLGAGEETGNVEIRIPAGTLPGAYTVTLRASSPPLADQTVTFSVTVTNATFTISLDEAAVWVPQNGNAQVVATVVRSGGYVNGVAFTAAAPAGITVSFSGPTSAPVVTVDVGPAVAPGSYPVTITGTGPATPARTAVLTVNVLSAPAGAPAAVHIAPASATARVGETRQFVATLLDAGGNRTMPAANGTIEIVTVASGVANVESGAYHPGQLEQRAVVKGFSIGTTDVRAYYRVDGVRVLGPVASPLTVTP